MFKVNKISYKIAIFLVLVSFILTSASVGMMIYYQYNLELKKFAQEIQDIKTKNKNSLEHMLWFYDLPSIQIFLDDLTDSKKISYATIILNDNSILESGDKTNKNVLKKEFHIMHIEGKHEYRVGHFTVYGNLNYITSILKKEALFIFLTEFIKAIFMSIFVIWLIKYIIINNLEKFARKTKEVTIENIHKPVQIENKKNIGDELDVVLDTFNEMRENLFDKISKTRDVQKELVGFKNAVENSFNVILITDTNKKITYVNDVFEKVTGYKKEEVIGKNPKILQSSLMLKSTYKSMYTCLDKGEKWDGEFINLKKDGSLLYEKASIMPIIIDGKVDSYLAIKLDITKYKAKESQIRKLNKELEERVEKRTMELKESVENLLHTKEQLLLAESEANEARQKAESANSAKSVFLANISHELKTPLNGIVGLVYLNKQKTDDKKMLDNLNKIDTHSSNLLRLIGDLLDASKLEAKEVKIKKEVFNLIDMIKFIHHQYEEKNKFQNTNFLLNYDKNIPKKLEGDSVRIYQVITNLLNNAFKFTEKGNIFLEVEVVHIKENRVKLEFRVQDDGIGISKSDLKNVFDSFYQTKISQDNYMEGSGLGLNISKNLVNQMGGDMWVSSKQNQGSTFYFDIELDISDKKIEDKSFEDVQFCEEGRVLVVDDKEINRDVICGILSSVGILCDVATNGLEALRKIEEESFLLVLLDIKMPIMNGWECADKIRMKYDKDKLPIIITSANESQTSVNEEHYELINDYIEKPINPELFLKILSKYLNTRETKKTALQDKPISKNLDVTDALNRFINNEEVYVDVLKRFLLSYEKTFQSDLLKLLELKDKNKAIEYLHTLKGLVGNISAKKLFDITKEFHDILVSGKDYKQCYNGYKASFEELIREIYSYTKSKTKVEEEIDLKESREEILEKLLEFSHKSSTEAQRYFAKIKSNFIDDKLFNQIEVALRDYDYQGCIALIEGKDKS